MMRRMRSRISTWPRVVAVFLMTPLAVVMAALADDKPRLVLHKGDRIILIGNTLAERMQYYSHFETLLHARFPRSSWWSTTWDTRPTS